MKGFSKGLTVLSSVVLIFASLFAIATYVLPASAVHTSSVNLYPEWSPANTQVAYSAEFCKGSGDTINEVRIYKNYDGSINYTNFGCDQKPGWELGFIGVYPACFYVANTSSPDYNPLNTDGECQNFTFTAKTPQVENCGLAWQFETRDVNQQWQFLYDATGVDNTTPVFTKLVEGPQLMNGSACPDGPGEGQECWVRDHVTNITVSVTDPGAESCDQQIGSVIPSGVEYCNVWVVMDGSVNHNYNLTIYDDEYSESSNGAVKGDLNDDSNNITFSAQFLEDSVHELKFECFDRAGNELEDNETFRVDSTAPNTSKFFEGPQKIIEGEYGLIEWIDGVSTVVLDENDPDPTGFSCNIGVNQTFYRISAVNETNCWKQDKPYKCDPLIGGPEWNVYEGPIGGIEESCHMIEWFSIDELGNTQDVQTNCFFVDKTAPNLTKDNGSAIPGVGEPNFTNEGNPEGEFHWLTTSMPITFTCEDQEPHPSGDEEVCFKVSYDYPEWGYITDEYCDGDLNEYGDCCVTVDEETNKFVFYFREESMHNLEYYCKDAVNKTSEQHVQYYKVDNTAPSITKTMIGEEHLGYRDGELNEDACPPKFPGDECYVRDHGENGVHVDVQDGGEICAVDNVACELEVWWHTDIETCDEHDGLDYDEETGRCLLQNTEFGEEGADVIFAEDSTHDLIVNCEDALGNQMETDEETFLVDSTPPATTKEYGDPFFEGYIGEDLFHWTTSDATITLTSEDAKVGVENVSWRVTLLDIEDEDCYVTCQEEGNGEWNVEEGDTAEFNIPQTSCHLIEFYASDRLNNVEETHRQCVFVDNEAPVTEKDVGDPRVVCDPEVEPCDYYVSQETPITFTCTDSGPHPVNHGTIQWRSRFAEDCSDLEEANWTDWSLSEGEEETIYFEEDSCHQLEYFCTDILGNEEDVQTEIDIVDTQPPFIDTTIVGPQSGECPEAVEGDECFIDLATTIHVESFDPEPHPVDNVMCKWSYAVYNETGGQIGGGASTWLVPPLDISFPEESRHYLTIVCEDALGNNDTKYMSFSVDHTPPVTWKSFDGPQYPEDGDEPGVTHWINSSTDVELSVYDAGPHKSGINKTYYRVTLLDSDEPCIYPEYPEYLQLVQEVPQQTACDDAEGAGEFVEYTGTFNVPETSCHLIEYYSVDNVNKTEATKRQCVFVDNEYPLPNKTVGEPSEKIFPGDHNWTYYLYVNGNCWADNATGIDCWQVTTLTPITLDCVDQDPHPVDHSKVWFNVDFDGSDLTQQYCNDIEGAYNTTGNGYCLVTQQNAPVTLLFGEESEHNLKYYCEDALGNAGPIDDEKFKVEGDPFWIQINKKWNLISVPFTLQNNAMGAVFDSHNETIVSVWGYDAQTSQWHIYTPDGIPNDDLTTMKAGDGYWVLALENDTLLVGGSLFSPVQVPPSKPVVGDAWNLLGYYGTDGQTSYQGPDGNGKTAQCALYSLGDTVWDNVASGVLSYWEPYNPHQWNTHNSFPDPPGLEIYDHMDPGAGYWVFPTEDGVYAPSTTCGIFGP